MKFAKLMKNLSLALSVSLFVSLGIFAQGTDSSSAPQKRDRITGNGKTVETAKNDLTPPENGTDNKQNGESNTQAQTSAIPTSTPPDKKDPSNTATSATQTTPDNPSDDAAQIVNYYVNYIKEYRLGPEDVISVEVFGQPNYSKLGVTVPPTARISYPLIGGVMVGGRTTEQVEADIKKRLEEYIIDPQVTVSLDKVGSARYSVMGDVAQQGVKLMTRKVMLTTALNEAGGILPTGSRSKVTIYRNSGGMYAPVLVNVDAILKGKAADVEILPGDQILVPGNKMKAVNGIIETISKVSVFRLLFGSPL